MSISTVNITAKLMFSVSLRKVKPTFSVAIIKAKLNMACVYGACRQCLSGGEAWVDDIIRYRNIFKAIIDKIFLYIAQPYCQLLQT